MLLIVNKSSAVAEMAAMLHNWNSKNGVSQFSGEIRREALS